MISFQGKNQFNLPSFVFVGNMNYIEKKTKTKIRKNKMKRFDKEKIMNVFLS